MARIYFKVVGNGQIPYGACGRRIRRGERRTVVDFGKLGVYRVPNNWLSDSKPDAEFGKVCLEAFGIARKIGLV